MAHITIGTTSTRVNYTVSGTTTGNTTPLTIPFEFFDFSDLKVQRTVSGTTSTLTYNASPSGQTQYSIQGTTTSSGGYDGGTVTTGSDLSDGDKVTIYLDMQPQRDTDFPTSGTFNINTLNTWIDKMMVLLKQQKDTIALKMGRPTSSTESYSLDWPDGATSTGKALLVSTSGLTLGATAADITAASTYATNAATSATASASSATSAASSATTATNAAVSLTGTTSSTSLAIGTGSKAFTISAGLSFVVGDYVLCASDANEANHMHGQITAYSGTTLTVNVTTVGGSGTLNDWVIRRSGPKGATGATGSTGAAGATGASGSIDDAIAMSIALG